MTNTRETATVTGLKGCWAMIDALISMRLASIMRDNKDSLAYLNRTKVDMNRVKGMRLIGEMLGARSAGVQGARSSVDKSLPRFMSDG